MKKKTTKTWFKPITPKKMANLSWPQAKARFPLLRPLGDADRDGLKNKFDCKPFDRTRKGEDHEMPEEIHGFSMVYKKGGKKQASAEELIEELD